MLAIIGVGIMEKEVEATYEMKTYKCPHCKNHLVISECPLDDFGFRLCCFCGTQIVTMPREFAGVNISMKINEDQEIEMDILPKGKIKFYLIENGVPEGISPYGLEITKEEFLKRFKEATGKDLGVKFFGKVEE